MTFPTTPPEPPSQSSPSPFTVKSLAPPPAARNQSRIPSAAPTPLPDPFSLPPDPVADDAPTHSSAEPSKAELAADKRRQKLAKTPWKKLTRGLVETGGLVVHERLAVTEQLRQEGVWLTDDDDQEGIGDPFASMLERRIALTSDDEDIQDLMSAGLSLVAYLMFNLPRMVRGLINRRRQRAAEALKAAAEHE